MGKKLQDATLLQLSCKGGYRTAQYNLAWHYMMQCESSDQYRILVGRGIALLQDFWCRIGGETKARSLELAGEFSYYGWCGMKKGVKSALEQWCKSASYGRPRSQMRYAIELFKARKGNPDETEKRTITRLLNLSAEQGLQESFQILGEFFLWGKCGFTENVQQAIQKFSMLDNPSEAPLYNYAMASSYYFRECGTEINYTKALHFFQKSLSQGMKESELHMGLIYVGAARYSKTAPPGLIDMNKGIQCLKNATDNGIGMAPLKLAQLHFQGHRVPKNKKEALRLFHQSASLGCQLAYRKLGMLYDKGTPGQVCRDIREAVRWYKLAESARGRPPHQLTNHLQGQS
ncbi:hypothetical protein Pelo_5487 [Pelomyxa schiedti]|nr:hypothetical protein Pelo_5487 [Pelomyxa schiedti]